MGEQRSQETPGSAGGGHSEVTLFSRKRSHKLVKRFVNRRRNKWFILAPVAEFRISLCAFDFFQYWCLMCILVSSQWFNHVVVSLTGRHTLWRCLQSTVTPVLASMLEVMDRYANLDLLSDDRPSPGLMKLWLEILADSQVLNLTPVQKPRYCVLPFLYDSHSEFNQHKA